MLFKLINCMWSAAVTRNGGVAGSQLWRTPIPIGLLERISKATAAFGTASVPKKTCVSVNFASSRHNFSSLLKGVHETCQPKVLVGSSSAGEFTAHAFDEGAVSAVAFRSSEMRFNAAVGHNLRGDREAAAKEIIRNFQGVTNNDFSTKAALVLTDALAGHADDFVEHLTKLKV